MRLNQHYKTCRPRLEQLVKARGRGHPGGHLHWGGLKAFADGSLGSHTALMKEPYTDDPSTNGIRLKPYLELEQLVQTADATGLQVCATKVTATPLLSLTMYDICTAVYLYAHHSLLFS